MGDDLPDDIERIGDKDAELSEEEREALRAHEAGELEYHTAEEVRGRLGLDHEPDGAGTKARRLAGLEHGLGEHCSLEGCGREAVGRARGLNPRWTFCGRHWAMAHVMRVFVAALPCLLLLAIGALAWMVLSPA